MTEKERMLSGGLYNANDEELIKMHQRAYEWIDEFNATKTLEFDKREKLVRNLFKKVGSNCCINKPFYVDYGSHISIGDNFYANFDCMMLDVNTITIGNNVFLAPHVCLYTPGHPIDKDVRNASLEYGKPIRIGDDVWIGGNTVINPGVTIGSNVVIGSASVVTHDIPDNVVAAGNPCRIIRPITEKDKEYWNKQKEQYMLSKKEGNN
jgi:maltose O-acetyltransferase